MGMTDKQFNAHLRSLITRLQDAREAQDWELIKKLEQELQKNLED